MLPTGTTGELQGGVHRFEADIVKEGDWDVGRARPSCSLSADLQVVSSLCLHRVVPLGVFLFWSPLEDTSHTGPGHILT